MDKDKLVNFFFGLFFSTKKSEIFNKLIVLFTEKGFFKKYPTSLKGYEMLRNIAKCLSHNYILKNRVSKIFTLKYFIIEDLKFLFIENNLIDAMKKAEEKASEFSLLEDSKSFNVSNISDNFAKWINISTDKEKEDTNKKLIFFNKIMGLSKDKGDEGYGGDKKERFLKKDKSLKFDDSLSSSVNIKRLTKEFYDRFIKTDIIKKTFAGCWICFFKVSKDDKFYEDLKDSYIIKIFERTFEVRYDRTYFFGGIKFNLISNKYLENINIAKKSIPYIFNKYVINVHYKSKVKNLFKLTEDDIKEGIKCIESFVKS